MVNSLYRLQQAVTKVRRLLLYERFTGDSNAALSSLQIISGLGTCPAATAEVLSSSLEVPVMSHINKHECRGGYWCDAAFSVCRSSWVLMPVLAVSGSSSSHGLLRPPSPAVSERLHRGHHHHAASRRLFRVSFSGWAVASPAVSPPRPVVYWSGKVTRGPVNRPQGSSEPPEGPTMSSFPRCNLTLPVLPVVDLH